jgi:hypothetical protein
MLEQPLLKDIPLEKDLPIAHLLRITNMELKDTKSNKKFLQFSLADKSTELRWCKKWDSSETEYEKYKIKFYLLQVRPTYLKKVYL